MARSPAIAPTSGGGGSDPTLTSTLGDIVDTTSPYSYAPTLTHTGTVLTTITRASDSSSVSVSGSTTTTPTATCTAADAVVGDSFHCESVATDGGITKTLVTTVFMEGTGGGSAYDVSPPAATTEATASGVALGAKTFSAFTGADAGSIDGYTARTVNAVGSTSWSGSGLGAYTPSGGADADAGVLALDATIGGVVVATALHDYSRAAAGGGGGDAATEIGELSLLTDMTAGSKSSTGSFNIYEADGTTLKATGEITTSGSLSATWYVEWDTSYGIRAVDVKKAGGSSGSVIVAITPASSVFASADWSTDDVVAQLVYGASSAATDGAVWYGVAPYGSLALTVNDGRSIKATSTSGTVAWTGERWGNYDSDTITSLGSTAIPSSLVYFQELRALQNRVKVGASDYIDPTAWASTSWDGRSIGEMLVAVDDDPATERYAASGGYTIILAANNNDAANPSSSTFQKAKFWARNVAPETVVSGLSAILNIDWAALHAANGDYDFLADGPGGDGTHTYGGYTFELSGSATAVTKLEVISTGLDMDQGAGGAFVLGVDCRAVSPAIDPTGLARCIGIWASAVSDASGDGVQVGLRRNASIGTWEVADTAIRYREADATPDLYSISYNGSTHDVLASGTLTANADVRMQVDLDNFYGTIARGDTGTATDPADSDTLQEFSRASYGSALASFTGTYPGTTSYWAYLGAGGDCHGVATRLIVYGLEA